MCLSLMFAVQVFLGIFQFWALLRFLKMVLAVLAITIGVAMALRWAMKFAKTFFPSDPDDFFDVKDGWFGKGPRPDPDDYAEDPTVHPFTINIPEDVLDDLQRRLENTRLTDPVEGVNFHYGFCPKYMRELVQYWKKQYSWRQYEKELNKYPHFKTRIEGIDVHFMHIKPDLSNREDYRVIPLMIIHGWPGCFAEFYKMIPLLTTPVKDRNFVFEVICPSIPGYGFSEAPHHPGLNSRAAGRIFIKLMERIGHKKFYVQGGDWGSNVATNMARFFPDRIKGLHVNMIAFGLTLVDFLKFVFIAHFPSFVTPQEYKFVYPVRKRAKILFQETGYFHMQCTKPDTLGCSLSDSPAGLAAYLLEKFSVATNINYLNLPDGGLTKKFNMDELLTIVTIYWVTNSFASTARFYKENLRDMATMRNERAPVMVPSGVAVFPNEVFMYPRTLLSGQLKKLLSYTIMPKGGHFAALEEPKLLADDIWNFVGLCDDHISQHET